MENPRIGRTRWRRFTVLFVPALAVVGLMVYGTLSGVLAISLAISGMPFKLSATSLSGSNFIQFAAPDAVTNPAAPALVTGLEGTNGIAPPGSTGGTVGSTTFLADTYTYIQAASINTLHQTVCAPVPSPLGSLGNLQVTIDAGGGAGGPATADALVVQAPALKATSAVFNNIKIGEDTATAISGYGYGTAPAGTAGLFSQAADHVTINGLTQIAVGTEAGTFTLPDLILSASFVASCP